MLCDDLAIDIVGVSKYFYIYQTAKEKIIRNLFNCQDVQKRFYALKDVTFQVKKGQTLGIIGQNGSGKSTLLQLMCNISVPSAGKIHTFGRVASLLELGAGFQPEFTGQENIYLNAAIFGLTKQEIDVLYDDIVDFSGLKDKIHCPVKNYSSGMYVRLGFAIAIFSNPDILVIDEALSVGDELFQRKCYSKIRQMQQEKVTIIFVSHISDVINEFCDEVILLHQGQLLQRGSPRHVLDFYHKLLFCVNNNYIDQKNECVSNHSISNGAKILNYKFNNSIKDSNVIIMETGKNCSLSFDIYFENEYKNVRGNFRIYNKTGTLVAGFNTAEYDVQLSYVKAMQMVNVKFSFDCLMLPGYYYITLGCSAQNLSMRMALARITDAFIMQVVDYEKNYNVGIVDLQNKVEIINYYDDSCAISKVK